MSYNLSKMGMNRLVEHIHRDHGERDGVQAFAVHPVSCFILVVFVFFEGLGVFFLTSYTTSSYSSSSQGRSPHRRNKTAPRNAKWRHLVQRYVPYPLPSSLPPFTHPLNPIIFLTTTKKIELTDDETLCGGFLTWLTSEKRPWLSGRYLSATWDVNELELKKDEIVNENKLVMRMVI